MLPPALVVVSFLVWAFLWGVPGAAEAVPDDVAVETEAAQGLTGFNYSVFSMIPAVSDGSAGKRVAFVANARKPPPGAMTKTCLFADDTSGTGAKIACVNDSVDGRSFRQPFHQPSMNAAGDVAWSAGLNTVNNRKDGVFWWDGSTTTIVVLAGDDNDLGDTITQFDEVVKITSFVVFRASLDTAIQEIYRCDDGDNCSSGNGGSGGNLDFLLGEGSGADGRDICSIKSMAASDYGIAVIASTDTTGNCATPDDPQDAVIRMAFGGSNDIIALTGGSPGDPTGTTYAAFFGRPAINGSGTVAFLASVTGDTNARVIYLCDTSCPGADPTNLAQTNTFDGDFLLKSFSSPVVDDSDLVAFTAGVRDVVQKKQFEVVYTVNGALTRIAVGLTAPSAVPDTIFQDIRAPSISPGGKIAFETILRRTAAPKVARDAIFLFE